MAKPNGITKKRFDFDAAGWLFWIILFLVLLGPCIWGVWKFVYPDTETFVRLGSGAVLAALGAGIISWGVNAILQRQQKKERLAQRKRAKKQK